MTARILLLDIETAPSLGFVWGKWQQDVIEFKQQWYMLSFAYKWLDQKKISVFALPDFPAYDRNPECDRRLVSELWRVIDQADIIIAHNGDRFDLRKSNARFIAHGLIPPSPYKSIDTLKIARKHFKFESNRLDDLGQYLRVGRKLPNTGKSLWLGCMAGNKKAWRTMKDYNAQDVALLERVYLKLRPWASTHPNLTHYSRLDTCPVCQSRKIVNKGFHYLASGAKQRMMCKGCGHRFVVGKIIK